MTNVLKGGRKTVTTAGTRVQLVADATNCEAVIITAETDNTDLVVVGGSDVVAALATRNGTPLAAGESVSIPVNDLSKVYLDALVNTEGVTFSYVALSN